MREPMFTVDDLMQDVPVQQLVLEQFHLGVAAMFDHHRWQGPRDTLRVGVQESLRHLGLEVRLEAFILALPKRMKERVPVPANWRQHLKQATLEWLRRGGEEDFHTSWRWCVERWLVRRLGAAAVEWVEVKVFESACPHLGIPELGRAPMRCVQYHYFTQQHGLSMERHHVYRALAILEAALQPVSPPGFLNPFAKAQGLEEGARAAVELLKEAADSEGRQ